MVLNFRAASELEQGTGKGVSNVIFDCGRSVVGGRLRDRAVAMFYKKQNGRPDGYRRCLQVPIGAVAVSTISVVSFPLLLDRELERSGIDRQRTVQGQRTVVHRRGSGAVDGQRLCGICAVDADRVGILASTNASSVRTSDGGAVQFAAVWINRGVERDHGAIVDRHRGRIRLSVRRCCSQRRRLRNRDHRGVGGRGRRRWIDHDSAAATII